MLTAHVQLSNNKMNNFDLKKYLAENPLFQTNEIRAKSPRFNVDDYYDEDRKLIDLGAAFRNSPDFLSYEDVLDIIDSYEDEEMLNDFKVEFPEGEPISKNDYSDFILDSDISEIIYIQADWIAIFDDTIYEKARLI